MSVASALAPDDVLAQLGTDAHGLAASEAARRLVVYGPNAVRVHRTQAWEVLVRQVRSPILVLLASTAVISFFLAQRTDSVVIGAILLTSVGLGFVNEFRAERASQALHAQVTHRAVAIRGGVATDVDVREIVPGDIVRVSLGEVVPADLRLIDTTGLECDESVLTGESLAAEKSVPLSPAGAALGDLASCALMGTVVRAGSGVGVVVATGALAEFGRIVVGLGGRPPETQFQAGLRQFSVLLLQVAMALTTVIFLVNLLLARPLLQSLLFSLAIAVGITPQLLPAVVSTCLAAGSGQLARRKVLVKRLVCVEDLGDMDILVTDKTGTLTDGQIAFTQAIGPDGKSAPDVLALGLLATDRDPNDSTQGVMGGNPLDLALWAAQPPAQPRAQPPAHTSGAVRRVGVLPFDHTRRMTSALVESTDAGQRLIVKGAPESVLACCVNVPAGAQKTLEAQFAAGSRVVAVASRATSGLTTPTAADESGLTLAGFLVFLDPPKASAAASLIRLASLGIAVKICTGDNPLVAEKVCADLGLESGGTLTGTQIAAMSDGELAEAARTTTIFARVSPEQKARLVTLLRAHGRSIGFLGDGVNDALALHSADVGISVDTATDVAKDAADVILLEKDLGVLAEGVNEGRRIFANTIKYVLMGTSSNFGNMFSAAAASSVLSFLPMLPSQILLNNLLYDAGQLTIPTDRVDPEQLKAPSHWDIGFIRRFMLFFGTLSSLFDVATFALMLTIFHAGPPLFRAGWFAESLATQTLVIFVIRTRRRPFLKSRPSTPLLLSVLATVVIGVALPFSPLRGVLGFATLPLSFLAALAGMVVLYLALVELGKGWFFAREGRRAVRPPVRRRGRVHRVNRRAARFTAHPSVKPSS